MLLSSFLPFRSQSLPLLANVSMKLGNKWFSEQHKQITIKTVFNTDQNQKPMRMGKRRSNRIVPRVESRNCWINVGCSKSRTPGSDGASHRPSRVEAMAAPAPLATVSPGGGPNPCVESRASRWEWDCNFPTDANPKEGGRAGRRWNAQSTMAEAGESTSSSSSMDTPPLRAPPA